LQTHFIQKLGEMMKWLLLLTIILFISGCSVTSVTDRPTFGTIKLVIIFPQSDKLIPPGTNSFGVHIWRVDNKQVIFSNYFDGVTEVTIFIPPGTYNVDVYPSSYNGYIRDWLGFGRASNVIVMPNQTTQCVITVEPLTFDLTQAPTEIVGDGLDHGFVSTLRVPDGFFDNATITKVEFCLKQDGPFTTSLILGVVKSTNVDIHQDGTALTFVATCTIPTVQEEKTWYWCFNVVTNIEDYLHIPPVTLNGGASLTILPGSTITIIIQ